MAVLGYTLAIILFSLASTSDASCGDPFMQVGTLCIYVNSREKMTWHEGRDYCRSLQSTEGQPDLAMVTSCHDLNPLWEYIVFNHVLDDYWLGGFDVGLEGSWHWVDGSLMPMGIPFWSTNSPTGGSRENCLLMSSPSGYFDDYTCTSKEYVLCSV
ncbi:tetranectin-like protein isoform X1 [Panulirus ornatus]|uniref:tetranectin-like protein isoform X1 n=1 Tax=Panulirus ornatus TaxID=150431 RepID=UPI003A89DD0B